MLTTVGDLFNPPPEVDAICIPTNGVVKKDNRLVMGAGVAKIARDKFPLIDAEFGFWVNDNGNIPATYKYSELDYRVISFPTKHHWKDKSSIQLITNSAHNLNEIAAFYELEIVWLPAVGCGLGGLDWEPQVGPILSTILDNRFSVVFRG